MKALYGIFALTLAFQCLAAPAQVRDDYTELAETLIQYTKQEMSRNDPSPIPDSQSTIKNQNVSCDIVLTKGQSLGSSKFVVEKITSDPANMSVEVVVRVPQVSRNGAYKLTGQAYGRQVQGEGNLKVKIEDFKETIRAAFIHPEISVQLRSYNMTYEMASINTEMTGLTIEGLSPEEVQNFIDTEITPLFVRDMNEVAENAGTKMQKMFNPLIAASTLEDIITWAKRRIMQ